MSNDLNLSFRKSWSSCARLLTEGRLPVPKQYRHGRGGLEIVARKKGKKGNRGAQHHLCRLSWRIYGTQVLLEHSRVSGAGVYQM